jgi:hypothetical protein
MTIHSTSNSPFRERHTTNPFPWKPEELRRAASDLIAQFPNADSAELVRALTRAADSLAPQSGIASLLQRAIRVMRTSVSTATTTDYDRVPQNVGIA